ncbi:MAG: flagellar basal-body MS-ring/collar protein FliF [Verrucomicrobiae bacterium]|nr:flagellar basal-body MS-ring/collar protein FliF [Verrucomicrobiae bacterium]
MANFWKSLLEIWHGLSVGQRITIGATSALAAAVMAAVIWYAQKPQLSLLYAGLDPAEASKIVDHLRDQKIPYEIGGGGRSVLAPSKMVYGLRLSLAAKGIPRSGSGGGGVGFELFDKPSFGQSDFLQKANFYRALQGELARTIEQMEEVEAARVLIVPPNDRLFSAEKPEAKASVFLRLRSQGRLPRQQINAIRFLVANGIEGLKPGHVAIVDSGGNLLAEQTDENSAVGMSASQVEIRRNMENIYTSKVQTMLDQVLGPQQSVVRVTVDMNFDNIQQTEEKFDPTGQVVRSESTTTEDTSSPIRAAGGPPGTASNTAGSTNLVAAATGETLKATTKKSTTTNQYEISKTIQNTVRGMGEIRRVSVAVFINPNTERKDAEGKPIQMDKTKIENVIKKAVGFVFEEKGRRKDEIVVEEVPFAPSLLAGSASLAAKPTITDKLSGYIPSLNQIILFALSAVFILFFRSLLSKSQSEGVRTDLSLDNLLMHREKSTLGSDNQTSITVAELSKLIRENPGNTAQALKHWIAEGS